MLSLGLRPMSTQRCVPLLLLTDNRPPKTSSFQNIILRRPTAVKVHSRSWSTAYARFVRSSALTDYRQPNKQRTAAYSMRTTLLPQTELSVDNDSCHHPTTSWTAMIVAFCPLVGELLDLPMMVATRSQVLGKSCLSGGRDVVWTGLCGR